VSKLALATREQSAALAPSRAAGAKTITNYTRLIMKSSPSNELCVIGSLEFGLAQRGPVQLNYYVNQPDAFEAKTRARFQSGSGGGEANSLHVCVATAAGIGRTWRHCWPLNLICVCRRRFGARACLTRPAGRAD